MGETDDDFREKRVHPRVRVHADMQISGPTGISSVSLRDLSRGGARFVCSTPVGKIGDTLELFLPTPKNGEIGAMGEIVSLAETADGHEVSVRFSLIEPSQRDMLEEIIEVMLAGSGGGKRRHPRVVKRMEVQCKSTSELRAMVEDISKGGLAMTVAQPLVLGEELMIVLPDEAGEALLTLRARIVYQRPVPNDERKRFRVGLEFTNLRPVRRKCLDLFLEYLV